MIEAPDSLEVLMAERLAILDRLEAVIEQGKSAFIEVGNALMAINQGRLYRERGFKTFEEYTAERWGINRAHAYRQMDAARTAANLSPMGDKPTSERQARELASLSPGAQRSVVHAIKASGQTLATISTAQLRVIIKQIRGEPDMPEEPVVVDLAAENEWLRMVLADLLTASKNFYNVMFSCALVPEQHLAVKLLGLAIRKAERREA